MSVEVLSGANTGLPDQTKIAADLIGGAGTAPAAGDVVPYVKLDLGAAGASAPVAGTVPVSGTVAVSNLPATQPVSAASLPLPTGAATDTELQNQTVWLQGMSGRLDNGNINTGSIDSKTPALGQALAAASVPVVLTAAQQAALTPPAAIAGFALEAGHLATIDTHLDVALSTRLKPADTLAGVTTVGAVTAITNALPAGANAIGKVSQTQLNRVPLNMFAEAVAGAASEALVTMSSSKNNAAVVTGTSYTPTAGKNLRINALVVTFVSTTTTANTTRIRVRVNAAGAAAITSPIQFSVRVGWPSATFIANEAQTVVIPIPDGIEIPDGAGVAFSHLEAAANGTIDISAVGFEFTP